MGCTSTTKAGAACKARPLKDRDVCLAHSDAETRRSLEFVGGGPGSGRPANPRAVDVIRERIEQDIDRVIAPLWDALDASNKGGEDHATRIAAARELLDRGYGKPKQATELSGSVGVTTFADLAGTVE